MNPSAAPAKAEVWAIMEDNQKQLWYAANFSGLYRYDLTSGKKTLFASYPASPQSVNSNRIFRPVAGLPGTVSGLALNWALICSTPTGKALPDSICRSRPNWPAKKILLPCTKILAGIFGSQRPQVGVWRAAVNDEASTVAVKFQAILQSQKEIYGHVLQDNSGGDLD